MQIAVIEYCRNVLNLAGANSTEFDPETPHPAIDLMREWVDPKTGHVEKRDQNTDKGATMRLGAYPCHLEKDSFAFQAYGMMDISERHRHRYEFNNDYKEMLAQAGLVPTGSFVDGKLVEIVEIRDHPWFLGCQFHPEFKSRPMEPHPLFREFIRASLENRKSGANLS